MRPISVPSSFELWILDNVFQRFCDFTHKYLKLSFAFWAIVSCVIFVSAMLRYLYQGIFVEGDLLIILPIILAVIFFVVPNVKMLQMSRLVAYDDAAYGLENPYRTSQSDTGRESLTVSLFSVLFWAILSLRHGYCTVWFPILWICLSGYPFFSFCSVTPYCRNKI